MIKGFFPGEGYKYPERSAENWKRKFILTGEEIPVIILTVLAVGLGVWPNPLIEYISGIVSGIL